MVVTLRGLIFLFFLSFLVSRVHGTTEIVVSQNPDKAKQTKDRGKFVMNNTKYRWIKVTDQAPFASRNGAGAMVFQDRMWLIGGWNPLDKVHFPRICNNEVWSSSDGLTWRLDKPNTFSDQSFDSKADWEGRHTAGYVIFKNKMWLVGGDVNQKHYHFDVWNSMDGKSWKPVNQDHPVPWGPRALHHTVVFQNRIWVMGGQTMPAFASPAVDRFYNDIWTTEDGIHWDRIEPVGPFWSARGMIGGSAVFRDRLWIIGGGTCDTPQQPKRNYFNDVWSTRDGRHWQRHVEHAPWAPRQYHDVAVFDDKLWVLEGCDDKGNRKDVWYSSDGTTWNELPDTPWKPRHAASVFVFKDALWVVAGNNMESDVWKLVREPHSR